jgi:chemotaxis protein methyltransferase CheR
VETFYKTLREGGYLLLGHAESLLNTSTAFALRHLKNDMVYQKPCTGGKSGSRL